MMEDQRITNSNHFTPPPPTCRIELSPGLHKSLAQIPDVLARLLTAPPRDPHLAAAIVRAVPELWNAPLSLTRSDGQDDTAPMSPEAAAGRCVIFNQFFFFFFFFFFW
jgi:hypothetical protein